MIDELKKSLNSILNDRLVSPLFGTFIFSWLIWNWKIIYLTLFISEKQIETNKIAFIVENYNSEYNLLIYPLVSTLMLLTIVPFISNGTYWLSLIFSQWKVNKKNEIQKNQLITLEQSIALREKIKNNEKRFEELLEDKNNQIKLLEIQLNSKNSEDNLTKNIAENNSVESDNEEYSNIENIAYTIRKDSNLASAFDVLSFLIQRRQRLNDISDAPNTTMVNYFLSNNIIENDDVGKFNFTEFGKKVAKYLHNI